MEIAKRKIHEAGLDDDVISVMGEVKQGGGSDEVKAGEEEAKHAGHDSSDSDRSDADDRVGNSADSETSISSKDSEHGASESKGDRPDSAQGAGPSGINGDIETVQEETGNAHLSIDSWRGETPPLDLNYEAIKHIATNFLFHGTCIDITTLRRGGYHEIRILHFEDGWSCIARFTRDYEMLRKTESELATIEYVRKHTSIPVPEIYLVNHNENHVVGAPFVLMERLPGVNLSSVWRKLTSEHKINVVGQLAHVVGQLAELRFDAIGSLRYDGTLGPLLHITEEHDAMSDDAFTSTTDYFFCFLKDDNPARSLAARKHYPAVRDEIRSLLDKKADNPTLNAPYRLIHNDLASQNILVLQTDETLPPKITGIIDWDWSYTGPLYYLCEYPQDTWDWDDEPENFADNKILRKHFVATLIEHFPEGSVERKQIKQCFREKSFVLNTFNGVFMTRVWVESLEGQLVEQYLNRLRGAGAEWERLPYDGTLDWERDSDLTDSDVEESEAQSEESEERDDVTSSEGSNEGEDEEDDDERSDGEPVAEAMEVVDQVSSFGTAEVSRSRS